MPPGNKSRAKDVMVTGSVVEIYGGMEGVCDEEFEVEAFVAEI